MNPNVVNNFVKVSQEHTHVVVKAAGGLQGLPGPAGAGLKIDGSVDTYSDLPHHLTPSDAGVAYFVQADGLLYVWSGEKWPEEGQGAQFQGPRGIQGPPGSAATIEVGTTTTSPAGSDATVTNSGTTSAAVLNFSIPKGDKGDTGADGEDGFSPTVTATDTTDGIDITITDINGTATTSIDYRTIPDGVITTDKIADEAVTADKIDWTTMAEITESGTNLAAGGVSNYQMCIRYPNGLQVITGYYNDQVTLYKNNYADKTIVFTKPFSALPNVVVGLQSDSTSPDMGNITVSACTTSTTQFIARYFYYNAGDAGRKPGVRWTAIGFWQ